MTEFEKATAKVEKHTRKLAEAQNNLGLMYEFGHGVEKNYAEAVRWYTKAAEQGYASAQINLALIYLQGHGVKQDYAEALRWYTKAAEQGHAEAQYWVDKLTKKMERKND